MTPRVWYKAKLLPAAQNIFTDGFYPEAKRTGAQYVYFTQIDAAAQNQKVMVASRIAENSVRMLSLQLAQHFLEPQEKATRAEMVQLNELMLKFEKNL